jgi:hypothetical protein
LKRSNRTVAFIEKISPREDQASPDTKAPEN